MISIGLELRTQLRTPDGLLQLEAFLKGLIAPKPAIQRASVAAIPELARPILYKVNIHEGNDWCEIERIKVGARTHKKARKMHRSKVDGWLKSLERNGYEVKTMNLPGIYAVAMQKAGMR